jgi:hypothetical protein
MSKKIVSEACERNKAPILAVMKSILPDKLSIIELASGTGQHASFFTEKMPQWTWQPTDIKSESLDSIRAYQESSGRENLLPPKYLSVLDDDTDIGKFEAAFCANLIHISPWPCCVGMFRLVERLLPGGSFFILYGPFFEDGVPPAESNLLFDQSLKETDSRWGIRDIKEVRFAAEKCHFELQSRHPMPAQNLILVFKKK